MGNAENYKFQGIKEKCKIISRVKWKCHWCMLWNRGFYEAPPTYKRGQYNVADVWGKFRLEDFLQYLLTFYMKFMENSVHQNNQRFIHRAYFNEDIFSVCHAGLTAILNSNTADLRGSTIYITLYPSAESAKVIAQVGISEVVFMTNKYQEFDDTKAAEFMFETLKIHTRWMNSLF